MVLSTKELPMSNTQTVNREPCAFHFLTGFYPDEIQLSEEQMERNRAVGRLLAERQETRRQEQNLVDFQLWSNLRNQELEYHI